MLRKTPVQIFPGGSENTFKGISTISHAIEDTMKLYTNSSNFSMSDLNKIWYVGVVEEGKNYEL